MCVQLRAFGKDGGLEGGENVFVPSSLIQPYWDSQVKYLTLNFNTLRYISQNVFWRSKPTRSFTGSRGTNLC